ncbi:MAG: 1-acyl-sn-glycerol-3-phosphate acyltransferase [Lachnospiraceae bacterium]|nr:1-acyl-sn-glycerol-3-phosphate acyltransferase [Lachnospiraceae bacterium]
MLRFLYLIVRNIFIIPGVIKRMRQLIADENSTEEEKYKYLQYLVGLMQKTGHIKTLVYGEENLPAEGGYVMYPNHQGKYDAYSIAAVHKKPCTVVIDKEKSNFIFVKEIIDMIKGKRLDKTDVRQGFRIMSEVAEEVKAGRRYIVFPEGGYAEGKTNTLEEFKAGCFKMSVNSKTPIVPVVLIDSYKVMNSSKRGSVTTQVHFLPPIPYEEYQSHKTKEIAEMVKARIQAKLDEVANGLPV